MWLEVLSLLFLSSVLAGTTQQRESRLVQIAQGPVRGYKDQDEDIFVFRSIPYATAPTGVLRFRAPFPPPNWIEPLEAVDKGIVCPQNENTLKKFKNKKMDEDCLIANVYVPATHNNSFPVYVYVHGGAYAGGFGDWATPKKLVASQQIIAITFNYRLGPHGFLCLGTKDAPGNAGMKDQVALLRWVKNNIANFSGNPDEVTIGGCSAGSSAVELLVLSKMTDGLFNKVIPQSGANTALFSMQYNPIANAYEYAKKLNYRGSNDINELEKFYKSASYKDLFAVNALSNTDSSVFMVPCLERQRNEEVLLNESVVSILKSGNYKKLPMLYGFTEMEGILRLGQFDLWKDKMNNNFVDFLPSDLKFESENEKLEIANKIKTYYFPEKEINENTVLGFINYFTDVSIAYPILRSVKLQVEAENHQIYLYEFSYTDEKITPIVPPARFRGATHCAQYGAVMDDVKKYSSEEYEVFRKMLRKIWINFILTGKPIPEDSNLPNWPPVGNDWSPHMNINKKIELRGSLLKNRTLFWDEIYQKYYYMSVPPPEV